MCAVSSRLGSNVVVACSHHPVALGSCDFPQMQFWAILSAASWCQTPQKLKFLSFLFVFPADLTLPESPKIITSREPFLVLKSCSQNYFFFPYFNCFILPSVIFFPGREWGQVCLLMILLTFHWKKPAKNAFQNILNVSKQSGRCLTAMEK